MTAPKAIAIDGPAASGKTTLALKLAACLGYLYFDTGVMYRAVTLAILNSGQDIEDEAQAVDVANRIHIDVEPPTVDDGRHMTVLLNGDDVTWDIRKGDVDRNVSIPSAYAGVRDAMTSQQRRIASEGDVVMVGRDIGTVVLPDAYCKLYLDATPEVRAERRLLDYQAKGRPGTYEDILADIRQRDERDQNRAVAPLLPADDAHILDSSEVSPADLVAQALSILNLTPDQCQEER